jgi:mannose-6-phosphate isomerase-like protein (cupin superfamily)
MDSDRALEILAEEIEKRVGNSIDKKINDKEWHSILRDPNIGKVVERQWGYYKILHQGDGYSVKELTILPGKSLSDQRHFKRDEYWFVLQGELWVDLEYAKTKKSIYRSAGAHKNTLFITKRTWHRPYNAGNKDTIIIETWVGDSTEEDIERRNIIYLIL